MRITLRGAGIGVAEQACTTYNDTPSLTRKLANECHRSCKRTSCSPARALMRRHGNHSEGHGRPAIGEGKMYSHPASFGIESSSDIADELSAIHRGLPDFDSGTSSLRSFQSTCSHFA